MKEFLNPDQGYKLVCCEVGETPIPDNWIEVPEDAEHYAQPKVGGGLYFYKNDFSLFLCGSGGWSNCGVDKKYFNKIYWQREKVEVDNVNHPKHYTGHPSGIECIEITRHHDFAIGNAIKYLWRAGLKDSDNEIQDLEKAVWYIQDKIKQLKGE